MLRSLPPRVGLSVNGSAAALAGGNPSGTPAAPRVRQLSQELQRVKRQLDRTEQEKVVLAEGLKRSEQARKKLASEHRLMETSLQRSEVARQKLVANFKKQSAEAQEMMTRLGETQLQLSSASAAAEAAEARVATVTGKLLASEARASELREEVDEAHGRLRQACETRVANFDARLEAAGRLCREAAAADAASGLRLRPSAPSEPCAVSSPAESVEEQIGGSPAAGRPAAGAPVSRYLQRGLSALHMRGEGRPPLGELPVAKVVEAGDCAQASGGEPPAPAAPPDGVGCPSKPLSPRALKAKRLHGGKGKGLERKESALKEGGAPPTVA